MVFNHQKKIAYAEGFYCGMIREEFNNPYEDYDLLQEFCMGFMAATDRIEALEDQHYQGIK